MSWMLAGLGSLAMVAAAGAGWMWNDASGEMPMAMPHAPMHPDMYEQMQAEMPHEPGACPYHGNQTMGRHGGGMMPGWAT